MNLRQYFLMLLLSIPVWANGQAFSGIGVMVGTSFNYQYPLLEENTEDAPLSLFNLRPFEKPPVPRSGHRLGLDFNFIIGPKLVFQSGFRFAYMGFRQSFLSSREIAVAPIDFNTIIFIPTIPSLASLDYPIHVAKNHYFVELPILLRFEPGKHKLAPFFMLGLSPHFYSSTTIRKYYETAPGLKQKVRVEKEKLLFQKQYRNISTAWVFGVGLNANIGKNQFFTQHIVRYFMLGLEHKDDIQEVLSIGIELGLRRRLGAKK